MATHIEEFVTEVITEPESNDQGSAGDQRFSEQQKAEAMMKHAERVRQRLSAESFDD